MDPLMSMGMYLVVVSFIVFVLLMGPSQKFRHGPIGKLHQFLTSTIPGYMANLSRRLCSARLSRMCDGVVHYLMEERNPMLQIVYLVLLTGAVYLFYLEAWSHIPGPYLGKVHRLLVPCVISFTYASFFIASWSNPGRITRDNAVSACRIFEYDFLLFEPKKCRTCQLQKPARSKHCSMCKMCVAKSDHHCAWINNCVGLNNYLYFVVFLYATTQICMYGTYLTACVLMGIGSDMNLSSAYMTNMSTGERYKITTYQSILFLFHHERLLAALLVFAVLVGLVIFVFMVYQFSLIYMGTTTNESFKWEDIEDIIHAGDLYVHEKIVDPDDLAKTAKPMRNGKVLFYWSETAEERLKRLEAREKQLAEERRTGRSTESVSPVGRRVENLREVRNLYDKGFLGNLLEVFFPPRL